MSELRILSQLLRRPTTSATPLSTLLDQQAVNWHTLLELSITHGVAPLVDLSLGTLPPEEQSLIPSDIRDLFSRQYLIHLSINLKRWQLFGEMLSAFQTEHIPCLPLKGLILGPWLYGDAGRRAMTDLDVLVQPDHVPSALSALYALGYQRIDSPHEIPAYEIPLMCTAPDGTQTCIDLHWTFVPPHPNDIDPMFAWERASQHDVDGLTVLLLSPEDLLLTLCLHLRRNLQHLSLKLLVDLHWLLSKCGDTFDLHYLGTQARQLRIRHTASYALILMSHSLELPVSRALIDIWEPPKALRRMWARWAGHEFTADVRQQPHHRSARWWQIQLSKFTLMDNWSDVIRIAAQSTISKGQHRTLSTLPDSIDKQRVPEQVAAPQPARFLR